MKKYVLFLMGLLVFGSVLAQSKDKIKGNRQVVTKVYTLKPFHAIEFGEDLRVTLKPASDDEALELRADENLHEVLVWEVSGGVLHLRTTKNIVRRRAFDITIFTEKDLRKIKISEYGKIKTENKLKFESVYIELSNYAQADLTMDVSDTLHVNLTEKSKLKIDIDAKINLFHLTDDADLSGMLSGKSLKVKAEKTSDLSLGGSMKYVELEMADKSEFTGKKFLVKKAASVRLKKRANASLKGQSAEIEMFLEGKSHLHLAGDFNRYDLKKFEGESSLTREP
jgi:hypothetical protein